MNAEAVVWLIFILIWLISGIVKQIKQVAEQRPGQGPHQSPQQRSLREDEERRARERGRPERSLPDDDPMVQLLRQLGGESEVRPEEPPRESPRQPARERPRVDPSYPAPDRAAARQQTAQTRRSQARSVPDASKTKVAKMASIPEMVLPPMPSSGQSVRPRHGSSAMARSLRRELRKPGSARKAILLREVLGKPPGLQGLPGG